MPEKEKTKLEEFLYCLVVSREYGFNDWVVLTHAWHESGGFKRVIGRYNFWGIKKPEKWNGVVLPVVTHEVINGKSVQLVDYFIDFPTCEQALLWYCDFIKRLYPEAFFNRQVPELYFRGLVEGRYKYATDPKYPEKLIALCTYLQKENEQLRTALPSQNA